MIVFNLFAVLVLLYRWRRRLLTRGEVLLVAVWLVHGLLVEAQLYAELKRFKIDWRYLDPANAILWLEAAWGIAKLWSFTCGRQILAVILAGFALTNGAMVVKHLFPFGRRARIVTVCREAADRIRTDWKGPARDVTTVYSSREYHPAARPVVQGPKSFKSAQRLLGVLAGGRSAKSGVFHQTDEPDYWLMDENEDQPAGTKVIAVFSYGHRRYVLCRRLNDKAGR